MYLKKILFTEFPSGLQPYTFIGQIKQSLPPGLGRMWIDTLQQVKQWYELCGPAGMVVSHRSKY
jgi:hypothetical protein